jgi:hypothetical protein
VVRYLVYGVSLSVCWLVQCCQVRSTWKSRAHSNGTDRRTPPGGGVRRPAQMATGTEQDGTNSGTPNSDPTGVVSLRHTRCSGT